jgi:hypothetical protein
MTQANIIAVLKYLPVEVDPDYFYYLPTIVIDEMYNWFRFQGRATNETLCTEKKEKAAYIFCSIWVQQPENDTYKKMISQLEYYIKHSEYE